MTYALPTWVTHHSGHTTKTQLYTFHIFNLAFNYGSSLCARIHVHVHVHVGDLSLLHVHICITLSLRPFDRQSRISILT